MRKYLSVLALMLSLSACSNVSDQDEVSDAESMSTVDLNTHLDENDEAEVETLQALAANPAWRLYSYDLSKQDEQIASYILDDEVNPFYKLFTENIFKDCNEALKIYMLDGQEGYYYFSCDNKEYVVRIALLFKEYEASEWEKDGLTYADSVETLGAIKIEEYPWSYTGSTTGVYFSSSVIIQEDGYWLYIYESAPTEERLFTDEVLSQWELLKADLAATEISFSSTENTTPYLQVKRSLNNYHVYQVTSNQTPREWGYFFLKAFDQSNNELTLTHGQNEYTTKGLKRSVVVDSVKYEDELRFELWFHSLEDGTEEKLLE